MRVIVFALFVLCLDTACSPSRKLTRGLNTAFDTSGVFAKSWTGFILIDAADGHVVTARNADHYFTPASNTKILTLAASLAVLGDSLAGIEYTTIGDGIVFRGTGDPTFLHPKFTAWQPVYRWLNLTTKPLGYTARPFPTQRFGAGWCWDDYESYYQPERSMMPIYGNCFEIRKEPLGMKPVAYPNYFGDLMQKNTLYEVREEYDNNWSAEALQSESSLLVPFRTTALPALLQDTLRHAALTFPDYDTALFDYGGHQWETMHSCPVDTVYKWMMYESDNFFAEQLLLMAALRSTGVANQDSMIRCAVERLFPVSATPPRWVDGSGLSRYNLVTPRYLSQVLLQMYQKYPTKRLFSWFPAGGSRGTIKNWYGAADSGQPYIYAKTGSMSGVHCLSGYVLTKSGKTFVFSFMHNNFIGSSRPWKEEMQRLLEYVRERY